MDSNLFRQINRLADRTGWAHGAFKANAGYGIALFAVVLLVAYLDGRHHADLTAVAGSVWAALAALVALGVGQLIGGAVDRARPYEAMTNVHVLVDKTTDFSFPSDHATVAGTDAVGVLFANRRWGIVAGALAVLVAFTRVYIGAHSPDDASWILTIRSLRLSAWAIQLRRHLSGLPRSSAVCDRLPAQPGQPDRPLTDFRRMRTRHLHSL